MIGLALAIFAWPAKNHAIEKVSVKTIASYLLEANIKYQLNGPNSLNFKTSFPEGKDRQFLVKCDPKHHLVYIAVTNLGALKKSDENFCKIAEKLLKLNYGIAAAKLEWDESDGDIRLSKTFETEEGLSKSRFMGSLGALLLIAENLEGNI